MCLFKWCFNEKVLSHKWQLNWSFCLFTETGTGAGRGFGCAWKVKCWSCTGDVVVGWGCMYLGCIWAGRFGTHEGVCNEVTGWNGIEFDIEGTGKGDGTAGAGRACGIWAGLLVISHGYVGPKFFYHFMFFLINFIVSF